MALLRDLFRRERALSAVEVSASRDNAFVKMAGLVLVRQRPGKGNAVFITLEDETGITNIVLWARLLERFRAPAMAARLMLAEGRVQKSPEGVVHLMATRVFDRSRELDRLWDAPRSGLALIPDEEAISRPTLPQRARHPRDARILPRSRDFH
jgi:error-prone DNA polymerase